ncbi:hypothetical protein O6H91_04G115900 [Diphasiastrum complanatum]|nr:hypothetical protein O6H91_04G115900 [Diphasiastrum complanatum]
MKLGSCATVDLSTNLFSGDLSGMKSWPDSLEILDLSHNFLTENIPDQTAQLLRLIFLNLSHNGLSGSIPYSFGLYQKLTALDLTANQLTGVVPTSLFHSLALTDLRLAHNLLNGTIVLDSGYSADSVPTQQIAPLANFTPLASSMYSPLVVLDLSWNDLNGSIPLEIASLTTLEVVDLRRNELTGTISAQFSQLPNLRSLDLSYNQLMGELPSGLPLTLEALNVSYNHFSGHIPPNLQLRFPLSSFFPGNSGLSLTGGPVSPPPNTEGKRKINASALKGGLIGGGTALAVLICIVGLFMYKKTISWSHRKVRTPEFLVINKEFDQEAGITNSPHKPDYGQPSDMVAVPAATMRFSREQLLSPENGTSSDTKDTDSTEKIAQADPSPSRKPFTSFIPTLKQGESSSSVEPSTVLKVRSPEKLAGDLFLVDNNISFTAEELSRAPAEVLGRSSHGTSYKATLDNGHVLAVKWLREGLVKSKKDFTKQARKYANIRHPNVMPLRGYYWGPREHEKLVVSDFVSSGSLAGRLSERAGRRFSPLNWLQRLRIAVDIARGISYLHSEHRLPHGNLKATNVLLNGPDLDGRISDYGLHLLMTGSGTANQITNAGALGYRAPELGIARMPKPSLKADVYAFGVILLELLTGKGAGDIIPASSGTVDLPDWVRLQVSDGRSSDCFDRTFENFDENEDYPKGLQEVLEIALKCLSSPTTRPNIKRVYEELVAIKSE